MQQMLNLQKWPEELFHVQDAARGASLSALRDGSAEPGTSAYQVSNIMLGSAGLGRFQSQVLSQLRMPFWSRAPQHARGSLAQVARSGPLSSFFPRVPGVRPGLGGGISGDADSSVFGMDGSKRFASGTGSTGGKNMQSA